MLDLSHNVTLSGRSTGGFALKATIEWNKGFLQYSFEGDWDWEEFYQSIARGRTFDRQHSADVILDFRRVMNISPDAVLHLKPAAQIAEQNQRRYIIVARSSAIQTLFMLFIRIYNSLATRFYLVNTLEDAYALGTQSERINSLHPEIA
jgi:hypothetical protein